MKKLALAILFISGAVLADYTGDIYELNSNKAKKLFTLVNQSSEKDGQFDSVSTYTDVSGAVSFIEISKGKGAEFSKVEIDQKQMNANAVVEIKDGKIFFTKTEGGKTKESNEDIKGDTVISASFSRYVKSKWDELQKGQEVEFRFASWERMETVGFEIKKMGTEKVDGQDAVVIRMKASSFIIAAIVNPITFKYSTDGSKLLAMSGRVAPKQKKGESWKDLDADVFYTHK